MYASWKGQFVRLVATWVPPSPLTPHPHLPSLSHAFTDSRERQNQNMIDIQYAMPKGAGSKTAHCETVEQHCA